MGVQEYIFYITKFTLIVVFAVSSFSKIRDINGFKQTISAFRILPSQLNVFAANLFALLEFLVVAFLIFGGKLTPLGLGLAAILLVIFAIALASTLLRGIKTSCNCFGTANKELRLADVIRNVALTLITLMSFWTHGQQAVESQNFATSAMLVGTGTIFGVFWINFSYIADMLGFEVKK